MCDIFCPEAPPLLLKTLSRFTVSVQLRQDLTELAQLLSCIYLEKKGK
jgi:hypothetical protein